MYKILNLNALLVSGEFYRQAVSFFHNLLSNLALGTPHADIFISVVLYTPVVFYLIQFCGEAVEFSTKFFINPSITHVLYFVPSIF